MGKVITVDIYTRVSQLGDERMLSTIGQEADCRSRAGEEGLAIGAAHSDPGKSAWNPRVKRPGWDALMARLESGETGGVIVFDLARFTRRPAEGERLIAAAERGLVVLDSEHKFDLTSPDGKAAFRDHMKMAAYESDRLSTRVRRGKRLKAASGAVDMRRSFGFEADGVTQLGHEVAVIRELARRLLAGETQESLMDELEERQVKTVRGARWNYTTFRQIMTRPRNAGYIVYNGSTAGKEQPPGERILTHWVLSGVRLPGEPILDETTYRRIVALYENRKMGRPPTGRYALTAIAGCACGATLAGRPVTGTTRRQYWCKACCHTFVDCDRLDEWFGDWAIRTLSDPAHADAIAAAEREAEATRAALVTEADQIEGTLVELAGRLGRQEMSLARHDTAARPLDERLQAIHAALAEVAANEPALVGGRKLPDRDVRHLHWLEVWSEGSPAERRAMAIRALAGRRIVIGPGRAAKFDPSRVTIV